MHLLKHQVEALEMAKDLKNVEFAYGLGLGKTYIGSEQLKHYGKRLNLVVCQKSKICDWVKHFEENYPDEFFLIDYTIRGNQITAEDIVRYTEYCKVIVFINYELCWRREEISRLSDFTLLLDESSLIQNFKAKQTKCIMRLRYSHLIMLSGTPCNGYYANLWTQCKMLGWNIKKMDYESRYINYNVHNFGGMVIRVISKKEPHKNVEELKDNLRKCGFIFKKSEDVIDLPAQNFQTIKIKNIRQYKELLKERYLEFEGKEFVGSNSLTLRLGLRQLCSAWNKNKYSTLEDLLNSTSDRVVIFYNFDHEYSQIKKLCERLDRPVSTINGKRKSLENYESYQDSVTLVQYLAGAMGLNLQKANKMIFFSLTERSELFEQSKKRIHRIGQDRPCFYYLLITSDSVEENILRALEEKKDYTDELFRKEFEDV